MPLDGVRVLELADHRSALGGRLLADLGAEVFLIEPPSGGEIRAMAPFLDDQAGPERSFQHLYFNANKQSLIVDIETPAGAEELRRLAADADILIESQQPGALDALGLGADALHALNPHLILISATPYGQRGPKRDWRATDLTTSAAAGFLQISGQREDPPTRGPAHVAHTMIGLQIATAAMIALHGGDRVPSRPGAHFDISMQEATSFQLVQTSNPNAWLWRDEIPVRPALSQSLQCRDGKWLGCNISALGLGSFLALLDAAGIEHGYTPDDWMVLHQGDRAAWQYLENPFQFLARDLAARMDRAEMLRELQAGNHAAMPTLSFDQFADSEHYQTAGQFRDVEAPELDVSLSFSRSALDPVESPLLISAAPRLGSAEAPASSNDQTGHPSRHEPMSLMPLEGIRVVDMCWVAAGPLGSRILANFGAEVLKVESMARIDPVRNQPITGQRFHVDLPDLFNEANTGKKSVTLDLSDERGRELFRKLVATSDVVTNNYSGGTLDRMGLGYETLREINPGIIVLHLPGVGGESPWRKLPTLGNLLMAASGMNFLTGFPGRPPRGPGVAYPDFTSPHLLAVSVLAALRARERTGEGREIELSQLSGTVALLGAEWMRFAHTGEMPERPGNRDANHCPHGVYRTIGDDEWVAIAVRGDDQWAAFCSVIGLPNLTAAERFGSHKARKANEDELDAIISNWAQDQDKWQAAERLQAAGIAANAVENLRDMMEVDNHFHDHYQIIRQPSDPTFDIAIDREAIRFMHEDDRILQRAPTLGEHNEYALREIAGLSQEEFDALVVAGVIN